MTQMNALGISFKDFFHDFFFCLRVAPALELPAAEVKYLAVFQVFNHPRDRFLACCSNSTLENVIENRSNNQAFVIPL